MGSSGKVALSVRVLEADLNPEWLSSIGLLVVDANGAGIYRIGLLADPRGNRSFVPQQMFAFEPSGQTAAEYFPGKSLGMGQPVELSLEWSVERPARASVGELARTVFRLSQEPMGVKLTLSGVKAEVKLSSEYSDCVQ